MIQINVDIDDLEKIVSSARHNEKFETGAHFVEITMCGKPGARLLRVYQPCGYVEQDGIFLLKKEL